jgi:hypothetical protein
MNELVVVRFVLVRDFVFWIMLDLYDQFYTIRAFRFVVFCWILN